MATVGGFSRHKNLEELTQPDLTGKTSAVRQAEARENLGIAEGTVAAGTPVSHVADVVTTGTYATDDDAIVAAINALRDALVEFGIMEAS